MAASYEISRHAEARLQQRGISHDLIDVVLDYGTAVDHGGSTRYYMDKRAHRRARLDLPDGEYRRLADRLNIYLVVNGGTVVTAARRRGRLRVSKPHKPHKHPRRRRRRRF